jgi:hypothetical protein
MYNLLVSGDCDAWKTNMYSLDIARCVRTTEYTTEELAKSLGSFNDEAIERLKSFPCLFAYEDSCGLAPKFGWLKEIKKRTGNIIMEYELVSIKPWIDEEIFRSAKVNLDIVGWEMSRTHWAVKDVDLTEELRTFGVTIPSAKLNRIGTVNPEWHTFDVALSFPGETRPLVEKILNELHKVLQPDAVFYDNYYSAYLARPSLDLLLEKIYRNQSKLLVVFLSGDYQRKEWCGLEFRAVRDIILRRQHDRIMYIKTDDLPVEGVLRTDGYIDARIYSPRDIALFIQQRVIAQRLTDENS